jgi:hypothetical protein
MAAYSAYFSALSVFLSLWQVEALLIIAIKRGGGLANAIETKKLSLVCLLWFLARKSTWFSELFCTDFFRNVTFPNQILDHFIISSGSVHFSTYGVLLSREI